MFFLEVDGVAGALPFVGDRWFCKYDNSFGSPPDFAGDLRETVLYCCV
jgi:hypothetical protein